LVYIYIYIQVGNTVTLHGFVEIPLGWREQDNQLPQANQPKSPHLKYLIKHMVYVFLRITSVFSYLSSTKKNKKNTLHLQYIVCVAT